MRSKNSENRSATANIPTELLPASSFRRVFNKKPEREYLVRSDVVTISTGNKIYGYRLIIPDNALRIAKVKLYSNKKHKKECRERWTRARTILEIAHHGDPSKYTRCKKCSISCRDGGYQAIEMKENIPIVDKSKCSGCSLCLQMCPSNALRIVEV